MAEPDVLPKTVRSMQDRWSFLRSREKAIEVVSGLNAKPSLAQCTSLIAQHHLKMKPKSLQNFWQNRKVEVVQPRLRGQAAKASALEDENAKLLAHIEKQDWPNLAIKETATMGRSVVSTKPRPIGEVVCDYNGLLLNHQQTAEFLESAEANADDSRAGQTEYCFQFDFKNNGNSEQWMVNANNEPEEVGLLKSFGRLVNHCRKHPNLRPEIRVLGGRPHILLRVIREVETNEDLHFDYGDRRTGVSAFLRHSNCICKVCREKPAPVENDQGASEPGPSPRTSTPKSTLKRKSPRTPSSSEVKTTAADTFKRSSRLHHPMGLGPDDVRDLVRLMRDNWAEEAEPPMATLLLQTEGYPDEKRETLAKALLLHWRISRLPQLNKKAVKEGYVAFALCQIVLDRDGHVVAEDVETVLSEFHVGNSGSGGHPERNTRDGLVAALLPLVEEVAADMGPTPDTVRKRLFSSPAKRVKKEK